MASVKFLKGNQSVLNNKTKFEEGAFYLTSDTNRLYVAQSTSNLVELNKSITVVDNLSDLPVKTTDTSTKIKGTEVEVGQFYYINYVTGDSKQNTQSGNILAVCTNITDGNITWTQVNPDTNTNDNTTITNLTYTKDSNKTDSLVYKITAETSTKNVSGGTTTGSTELGTLTISKDDLGTVVVDVSVGIVASAADGNSTTISIDGTGANSAKTITLKAEGGSTLTGGNGSAITITSKQYSAGAVSATNNGGLQFQISDGTSTSTSTGGANILYHKITVDGTENTIYNQASLGSFYSADKVNTLISNAKAEMDAMTYKGVIGLNSFNKPAVLDLTGVQKGDTYLANAEFTLNGKSVKTGDLIIFNAADNASAKTETNWDIVPSANETDTTYSFNATNNVISLTPSTGGTAQTITLNGGNALTASTLNGQITIDHDTSGVTAASYGLSADATKSASTSTTNSTFTVPYITVDTYGHITAAADHTITLPKDSQYALSGQTRAVADNKATFTSTLTGSEGASGKSTSYFSIQSDNLNITADSADEHAINISLEWEDFAADATT